MADRVGQQFGNYRLIKPLGKGGFAEVYLGEHIHLNTQAAIKVLQLRLAEKDVEDFRNEARTIARLEHPNIVRVLDYGVQGDIPFLVMGYAPNGSLRDYLPKGVPLPLQRLVPYVKQVAEALQYAHDERVIHRDVKPENMLLGKRNEVLLSDFGISMVARTSIKQEIAGTAPYMAPEQIQGNARIASDQYSLGIVVYEWLTGDKPFHGSFLEVCTQQVLAAPPPLRARVPTIPASVELVVLTALAKNPDQRFGSVRAFAHALEQVSQLAQASALGPYGVALSRVCQRCGTLLPPGGQFCSNCGLHNTFTNSLATQQASQLSGTAEKGTMPPGVPASVGQQGGYSTVQPTTAPPQKIPGAFFYPTASSTLQKRRPRPAMLILLIVIVLGALGLGGFAYYSVCANQASSSSACVGNATPTSGPLFIDSFADNSHGWDTSSPDPSKYTVTVGNGSLVLEDDDHRLLPEPLPGDASFANFKLTLDATLSKGATENGYGVYIRASLQQGILVTYYRFELYGDGTYALYKGVGSGASTDLLSRTPNPAIQQQGNVNHIKIIANGSTITLSVNGQQLNTITDSSYESGSIALFVANLPGSPPGAQATFANLVVYPYP